jgi:secondary thiamine-phosphate synthase enzyme
VGEFKILNFKISFETKGEVEFVDLSDEIKSAVVKSGIRNGFVHIFAPHATGVLILTENEGCLLEDIKTLLEKMAPSGKRYSHASNAHAHLRSVLLPPDRTLPIIERHVELGTWQSLMFVETDVHPRKRTVIIQVLGEQ